MFDFKYTNHGSFESAKIVYDEDDLLVLSVGMIHGKHQPRVSYVTGTTSDRIKNYMLRGSTPWQQIQPMEM